ncbi:hypothetical protein [Kiloniella antarctica]|uniref:Lipoprotein n=1 Tax=Kiloniella antarctica TaxID=1550907 RepID=A0ABW5BK10_9PROT
MRRYLTAVALGAAFFTSACTTPEGNRLSSEQQLQLTCDGISSTIKVLAEYRATGDLSTRSIKLVDELRPSTAALCEGSVTDFQSALAILSNTAFTLLTIRKGAET